MNDPLLHCDGDTGSVKGNVLPTSLAVVVSIFKTMEQ